MSAVRGIPNLPVPKPQHEPEPSGMFKGAERKEVKERNSELDKQHFRVEHYEETAKRWYDKELNKYATKTKKGCVPELVAAREVREMAPHWGATGTGHEDYDNPMEYVADLWTDGYIDDAKAGKLLGFLQENGQTVANDFLNSFRENPVKEFLKDEFDLKHIANSERNMMLAWERKPERDHSTEELAALRKHVVQQLTSADVGLSKGQAAIEAIEVVQQLSENDLDKALESAAAKPAAIGPATQRELERRSAPATEQSTANTR